MLEQQNIFQKRQIAYKIWVSNILNGNFAKGGLSAGHIEIGGFNISRVNLIATLVYKSKELNYTNTIIDDGTGKISLRTFENNDIFLNVDVGEIVLIIGKIREYNNEKYIVPEILKKIDNIGWISVRKAELAKQEYAVSKSGSESKAKDIDNLSEEICSLIKKFDKGDGASIDEVINSSGSTDAENILHKLLENGEIFELKPGKIKVLE
ncbi:MAG: hypothetical protein AABX33_08005 [Nanoarchaeota archaeon]